MPEELAGSASIMGVLAFVLGFAMVWHIWWLAIAVRPGDLGLRHHPATSDDDTDFVLPASEVERIENQRYAMLARAPRPRSADAPGYVPHAIPGTAS